MKHPLIQIKYSIPIYLFSWFSFAALLFFMNWYFDGRSWYESMVNSISFTIPVLILGVCIWYVVLYTSIEEVGISGFLLHHFTAAVIVVGIWIASAYQIRLGIFGEKETGLDYLIPVHWQIFMAFAIYDYIVMVYYVVVYYLNFKDKAIRESELQNLVKEAELTALKSQINPHFLFNSLNSVSSLTLSKPEQSRDMLVKLSSFLRYSLDQDLKELNSLSNELSNIKLYLDIEKVRFGERLQLDFEMDVDCQSLKIPNLILQPLYENAIKYGVHESLEPVTINTFCKYSESILKVKITNNFDPDSIPPKGNGIGLKNIQERLSLIYGRTDLLKIVKKEKLFSVYLEFPQRKES